jgi:N-acyl-D-aspartate/D-glutamate deacylase
VKTKLALFCLLTVVLFILILSTCSRPASYDLIIRDAQVLDGTGNPSFRADVGLRGRRIVALGDLRGEKAGRFLEARGLVVCPGFIDIHTHCDRDIDNMPGADNYISQGVTTVIGGNCGGHPFPLGDLVRSLQKKGLGPNLGVLVGHNTIREKVMGLAMRPPSSEEMDRMKRLVEEEMRAGALGLSTGLSYLPGIYADTEELVELASVAARLGGIYATHLRDQGQKIREAVEEAILPGIFFQMDEADVEAFLRMPWVMIGSDGGLQKMGQGQPHPRSYGTFPRVIARYVREKNIIVLSEAIRKMTSYPAQVLRLADRGLIKPGLAADLVIFNPQTFADTATFEAPHSFSRGLTAMLVNGQLVWENGRPTGRKPGTILYGRGHKS